MTDQLLTRGVQYGCAVTGGLGSMKVAVAAGSILYDNVPVTVAAVATLAITAANSTNPRWTWVVVDSAGTVSTLDGTAAAVDGNGEVPPPTWDGTQVVLAAVYVDAAVTVISASAVSAVKASGASINEFALVHTSPYHISSLWYGPVGVAASTASPANGDAYAVPFFIGKNLSLKAIGCRCTSAGTAGTKGRLGIYQDDGAGNVSLFLDAGQVALDAIASPQATIAVTLAPGWWWFVIAFQSVGATPPLVALCFPAGNSPIGADSISTLIVAKPSAPNPSSYGGMFFTSITGALPASLTSPDYTKTTLPGVWVQAA
jgi:hypothetical protein